MICNECTENAIDELNDRIRKLRTENFNLWMFISQQNLYEDAMIYLGEIDCFEVPAIVLN